MRNLDAEINKLETRLSKMVEYQDYFYREINLIRAEINSLKQISPEIKVETAEKSQPKPAEKVSSKPPQSEIIQPKTFPKSGAYQSEIFEQSENRSKAKSTSNIEEFVGRNLISLIGIIITILGVGIGAKYAIDKDLISPLTRIILGYLFAAGLFAVAVRLKKKYLNFSAVLLSGSLAMMYFLTFFAYSYYQIIPQRIAFLMMLVITAFSVAASINYNRQVITHIGLVGAYAVPFLLSENSGRAEILFGYMTIINFGILAISVKKFWKPLYYSSFIISWLIYAAWYLSGYNAAEHFWLAIGFAAIFFLTFYLTFLSYKLIVREEFNLDIVILVLLNTFIFYGLGYSIIESRDGYGQFLGIFTLLNALVHFFAALVIRKYNLGDRQNLHLALGLSVTFVTIGVPVQFEGNWTTVFWAAEAAYLFWVGRTKRLALYEYLSFPLMALAFVSLLNDWLSVLIGKAVIIPFYNTNFLISLLFVAAFAFIYFVNRDERYEAVSEDVKKLLKYALPAIFLAALYNTFRIEIGNYFHYQLINTAVEISAGNAFNEPVNRRNSDLFSFNIIWQINYTMLFLGLLSAANIRKIKSDVLGFVNLCLNALVLFAFLTIGFYVLSELRESYLLQTQAELFPRGVYNIAVRYFSYAFVAGLILASREYLRQKFLFERFSDVDLKLAFDFVFYTSLWWIASSELINLMNIFGFNDSYKLGLSILWGVYALFLIGLGIFKKAKHLRIGAIVLFGATLFKLFFYDIADLDTISKTIVFVSLGVLLLIISFLYNKYKDVIFE